LRRDAEQKAAKLLVDTWNVRKTMDSGGVDTVRGIFMVEPLFGMYRGDDYTLRVVITDNDDVPVDITGWSFSSSMKLSVFMEDSEAPVSVDVPAVSGVEAEAGVVYVTYPSDQTKDLIPTQHVVDLQRVYNGKTVTVFSGIVNVLGDVTRRTR